MVDTVAEVAIIPLEWCQPKGRYQAVTSHVRWPRAGSSFKFAPRVVIQISLLIVRRSELQHFLIVEHDLVDHALSATVACAVTQIPPRLKPAATLITLIRPMAAAHCTLHPSIHRIYFSSLFASQSAWPP